MTNPSIKALLQRAGLYGLDRRFKKAFRIPKYQMSFPPYGAETHKKILGSIDVVRYAAIALAVRRLEKERIAGAFAEVGVYRGELSSFLVSVAVDRTLHLFDTFAGFPEKAHEAGEQADHRFTDTSVEAVKRRIGNCANVVVHQGCFPDTAGPVLGEKFAFAMLDVDKYIPTLAALEVFYPRMTRGGYIFVHDYNSPESEYGVSRAVTEFFQNKTEQIIELPDRGGSVVIRKV